MPEENLSSRSRATMVVCLLALCSFMAGSIALYRDFEQNQNASRGGRAVFTGFAETCKAIAAARRYNSTDVSVADWTMLIKELADEKKYLSAGRRVPELNYLGSFSAVFESVSASGKFRLVYAPSSKATLEDKNLVASALEGVNFSEESVGESGPSCSNWQNGVSFDLGKYSFEYNPKSGTYLLANFVRP